MRSSSTLPPLQALRAFEAVARLMSFRRAGEELLITQSAVSHHMRQLEEFLGLPLFVRKPRSIILTPEGEAYLAHTTDAFRLIGAATAELRGRSRRNVVRISLLPSFAANWLVSRLHRFQSLRPDIDLELDPTLRTADIAGGEADIAIRYGDGNWPGVDARLLMAEQLSPVISPALLQSDKAIETPQDLLRHTLLFAKKPVDWQIWADAVGLDLSPARTIQLTDYNITLQAALDGQGIAIGRMLLIRDHVRTGRLVQPFPETITSTRTSHWLVTPKKDGIAPAIQAFMDWLIAETAEASNQKNGETSNAL
ncbi:transcriptional regulator GcvA [Phyllobacterium myrsinacearum]|uniref:LysR family glycine cleavage system transcriptional activator n=1 Tax=Phyllobacterium myrsinacearum TaxID=28101 RepID=A0A839ER79_9HYPH|nr:transcriptional regulator GcvA [Phyllobacterium myrsinacearum]MBA8879896.1 LysR family glycine cleavage system transcriptional activator [Phyllobacterium myrsinacearum]